MDKCPYCSAETRPGDNFCLNCGNRLLPSTPSPQQAQAVIGDTTIPAAEDWVPPGPEASPPAHESEWREDENLMTIANTSLEPPASPVDTSTASSSAAPVVQAIMDKVEHPARMILRTDTGEVLQEYALEKSEINIGRAPTSDILLSKDKLTSRRHATVSFENGDYIIRDERSANGTFVNGQQLEEMTPRTLQDGDHIGIGEHELVFQVYESASSGVDISVTTAEEPVEPVVPAAPDTSTGVTFSRLTSLPQPTLPEVAPLMAALATLDGQVSSFQEQLNATQEAMRNHDTELAQTANQLRTGVRRVSERMDNTIADVARSREQLAWAELMQLMEDVMNNPRDIEYVTKLARKARELNKVFQIHQNVLSTLAECTSLLRSLLGEDK